MAVNPGMLGSPNSFHNSDRPSNLNERNIHHAEGTLQQSNLAFQRTTQSAHKNHLLLLGTAGIPTDRPVFLYQQCTADTWHMNSNTRCPHIPHASYNLGTLGTPQ